ncbi:MAG: flagellar biosynthetic protein FliR [Acidobacteriia bacterium]|nr:flagellar biosynthetic protein FliR [Terriglobia bacterium]
MDIGLNLGSMLAAALFAGLRIGGVMVFSPFLGSLSVPMQVKAGLTLALTALLYPAYAFPRIESSLLGWTRIALGEAVIGLLLGLTLNFILEAAQFAGQMIGMQMGFSLVNILDPQTQVDTPVLSIFSQLVALLIFLQLDVHHWLLRGLAASFSYLPPGAAWPKLGLTAGVLQAAGSLWLVGLQIAAPVVAATLLADIALGFLGKASPQLPVLFFGLSIKSLLGLVVLVGTLALWPRVFERQFSAAIAAGEHLLHLAR